MRFAPRKSLKWFINRVGQDIVRNDKIDLFTPPVRIISEAHAKALHANQDKGNRFK